MAFSIRDGVLSSYTDKTKEVFIPDGVTKVAFEAFKNNKSINIVHIPSGCKIIDVAAFEGCENLSCIYISESLEVIDALAFKGCINLREVHINDLSAWCNIWVGTDGNPLSFGADLFLKGEKIVDLVIPNGVKKINREVFSHCQAESIVLPDSVTEIEENAFQHCKAKKLVVPKSIKKIGDGAFDYSGLEEIHFTDLKKLCSMASNINSSKESCNLFLNGEMITELIIPDGVKLIGESAFEGTSIERVIIPESVKEIGYRAFYLTGIKNAVIPSSVETVEEQAFYRVDNLTVYDSLNSNIMDICAPLFFLDTEEYRCEVTILSSENNEVLSKILILCENEDSTYNLYRESFDKERAYFDYEHFDNNFRKIKNQKFKEEIARYRLDNPYYLSEESEKKYRSYIKKTEKQSSEKKPADYFEIKGKTLTKYKGKDISPVVVIPDGVKKLGGKAFAEYNETITEIVIPEGVVTIEKDPFHGATTFAGCVNLKKISIPDTLLDIPKDTFGGHYAKTSDGVVFVELKPIYNEYENGLYLGNDNNPYVCLVGINDKTIGTIKVHEGCRIIYGDVFKQCDSLKKIILPNSIRKIEEGEQFEWVEKKGWKKQVPAKEFYCKKDLQINMPENYFKTTLKLPGKLTFELLSNKWNDQVSTNDLAWIYLFQPGKKTEEFCENKFKTDRELAVNDMYDICVSHPTKQAVNKLAAYISRNTDSIEAGIIEKIVQLAQDEKIKSKEIDLLTGIMNGSQKIVDDDQMTDEEKLISEAVTIYHKYAAKIIKSMNRSNTYNAPTVQDTPMMRSIDLNNESVKKFYGAVIDSYKNQNHADSNDFQYDLDRLYNYWMSIDQLEEGHTGVCLAVGLVVASYMFMSKDLKGEIVFCRDKWEYRGDYSSSTRLTLHVDPDIEKWEVYSARGYEKYDM